MPGVFKRKAAMARGKSGKWTGWYLDASGSQCQFTGTTDKQTTLEIARTKEAEARLVREGMVEPGERTRRESAHRPIGEHVEAYRLGLLAKGGTPKHCTHVAGVLARLFSEASIGSVADLNPVRIQAALGRMLAGGKSPRTVNHALGAAKAFARWLAGDNRIREVPRGLAALGPANQQVGRKRVRRAASMAEIERLFAAAAAGPDVYIYGPTRSKHHRIPLAGPERAALYRLALGTGFRAAELRAIRPEWCTLDGTAPEIALPAEFTKNGKPARQPITRELAAGLRPYIDRCERGRPILVVPEKTAKMLRLDLGAAGIAYETDAGVLDFHALRHSYITHLIRSGANPKIVQRLARHSTITLTLDRYSHMEDGDLRGAIEREGGGRAGDLHD